MKVEITVRRTDNEVEVIKDGATTLSMCPGEVLEQVIAMIYPDGLKHTYPMRTQEEWFELRSQLSDWSDDDLAVKA